MILALDTLPMYCTDDGGCLRWKLGVNNHGYPQARVSKGACARLIGRFVFTELLGNEVKRGNVVSTSCGDKLCVSPLHLIQKTKGKALSDAYKAGKRGGPIEYQRRLLQYQSRPTIRLNWEKVRDIRANANESKASLARKHGCHESTIAKVISGRSWRESPAASVFNWRPPA